MEEKASSRLSFAATGAVIEAPPPHTSEEARRVSGVDVPHAWRHLDGYDASDSEHEQLDWRGQLGDVGRYTGEESESDSSGGDTDDECISERVAAFEAQRARKARRERTPRDRRSDRVKRKDGRPLEEVQRHWDAGMTSSSHHGSDDDRESLTSNTDMRARGAEGASAETDRGEREHTTASEVATDDTFATRLTGRAVRFGPSEDAGTDQPDDRRRQPTGERWDRKSRVARVADFARWAERVTATADDTESQTKRARKRAGRAERRATAAAVSDITTAEGNSQDVISSYPGDESLRRSYPGDGVVGILEKLQTTTGGGGVDLCAEEVGHARSNVSGYRASGAKGADTDVSDITTADGGSQDVISSYPGDESLRRSYPGDGVVGILKKLQIGAGERRTVPAGHGFRTTATIEVAVEDDERNDAESERRRLERAAEQPSTKRRPTPAESDDVVRRRKRALTHDRGRNVLGSRQRQRWVHQLDEQGKLPRGAQRAEAIKSLGAQRQRAEAYAAAAARVAPHGGGRTAPVALGSSVPEGLEAAAAAGLSLDDIIKLPSYSMARVANESDEFVIRAPFPVTNVSPKDDPMPPVPDVSATTDDPDWRPKSLLDVYTEAGVREIMNWFAEMEKYEADGRARGGRGLKRPDDLILDDEFVQPKARGRPWYLLDHVRSGGALPIIPLESAAPLAPVINAKRARDLGADYHDKRVLDQLDGGHRNMSRCDQVTVLSANHSGALRFHEALDEQFKHDSAPEFGWLQPVVCDETPLVLQLGGERVTLSGFVASCPARVEPCNGVQQGSKVRTTTDKSWPKLEVLPDGSGELAVNPLIALDELAKSEFPKTTQFSAATAILMQAEPKLASGVRRDAAAAAAMPDFVYLWKIDLQSAYRYWHNHPSELWMYGKQWNGRGYLDCRTQFGDASMVQDFSRFTDFFLWLLRRLRDGDEELRAQCDEFGSNLWEAIDAVPTSEAYRNWRAQREAAGMTGSDMAITFEAGYIDDMFGAALGYDRAKAMRDLAVGLAKFLGFDVAPKKVAGPTSQMTVLGANLNLEQKLLTLDPDKAISYAAQVRDAQSRKSMRMTEFLSLTCKLVHAAQYRPAGRPYLTCMFTAMRQATRAGAKRVRLGRGVARDLKWWQQALVVPNDGVAFFPLNHFPPSGSIDLLEFAYDASGIEGLGAAMLCDDGDGNVVCYFTEHEWTDFEKRYHINVKEGIAGFAALSTFYTIAPCRHALAHGDNTTETITSSTNKSRSALQSVVLQHRAAFAIQTGVVTRVRRVKSKDNVLADPVSRLARATFKEEARKLGATKFVKLPMSKETTALMDELAVRLTELEEDGEPTSGTAKNVEEVYAREKYYESKQQAEGGQSTTDSDVGETAPARWGFVSGFCGLDSMSFAAEPLGGAPLAGFDVDETVQRLWTERTGIKCWGGFASVMDAACDGHLDWLRPMTLIYISGSPCPDYSRAGLGHGVSGRSGSLWIDDCHLGIRMQPPVIIREMVTGIFDTDGGAPFWAAVDLYRDAGYKVGWSIRMARRHGDPTSRRRVFLVAIRPECIVDGKDATDFFTVERTSSDDEVTVATCLDSEPEQGLQVPSEDVTWLNERDATGYDGPRLVGTIGIGGMGWSVYDENGPAVTQKTWGQGPGGATALYRDSDWRVRRLSPWEALRTHSFPAEASEWLKHTSEIDDDDRDETVYRLCGNSIPVLTLRDVIEHIVTNIIKPQVLTECTAAAEAHRAARREMLEALQTAAV